MGEPHSPAHATQPPRPPPPPISTPATKHGMVRGGVHSTPSGPPPPPKETPAQGTEAGRIEVVGTHTQRMAPAGSGPKARVLVRT